MNVARTSVALCLLLSAIGIASAQEALPGPPKVLVIEREWVKPGKNGALHNKSESAFVQAMTAAKEPNHYLAATSMSGRTRALFFIGYDSFAAWEKDNQFVESNPTLSAALDNALAADGDLLTDYDGGALMLRADLSLRGDHPDIAHSRYFEINRFVVKPGHHKEFEDLVKLYIKGFEKASPTANWITYQSVYGADNGGVYVAFSPMKSLAETDQEMADGPKFEAALSDAEKTKLRELTASSLESSSTNLVQFSPKMSYPSDAWVKADPAFWTVK
jgi:hypothetical protein